MLRWIAVAVVFACLAVPQASAKGPVVLCGMDGCRDLGTEPFFQWLPAAYKAHVRPAAPGAFYKLRIGDHSLAYWVPSTRVLRVSDGDGPATWVQPRPTDLALLGEVSSGLQPFPAPTRADAMVDLVDVPRGSATYLRLFTMGTLARSPVRAKRWLDIDIFGGNTPWTDGRYWMWVAKTGPYMRHVDGDVMRISPRVASRIRQRLPLSD
jgi:hypothetical protein